MGARMHTVTKVADYGSCIGDYELSNKVIDVFQKADDSWVSDDECEGEILRDELIEIIKETEDLELKNALQKLLDESDKDYEMVKFVIY